MFHVPYHIGEYLPGLDLPLKPDEVVATPESSNDMWNDLFVRYERLAEAVRGVHRPVIVSGDCMTALGTVTGLQRAGLDPGIVWLDAHGDVQTLETTASGYLGGVPLRLLAGYRPELIGARLGLRPVPEERITLAGARDLDPPEVDYLAGARIRQAGIMDIADALPDGPLYLHLDLDIIDPAWLPGERFPAPGGPDPIAVADALRGGLLETGRAIAVGIACTWYPDCGAGDRVGRRSRDVADDFR